MSRFVAIVALAVVAGCASVEDANSGGERDLSMQPDDLSSAADDLQRPGDSGAPAGCGGGRHIVVNELQVASAASMGDEFIELYNPCAGDVNLAGYSLVYRSATGTTDVLVIGLTKTITASGYLLVASTTFTGATADQTYAGSGKLAAAGGGVALRDPLQALVDSVGYGTATNMFIEGAVAAAPPAGQSLARMPNGVDSNHNDLDFAVAATPTPRASN